MKLGTYCLAPSDVTLVYKVLLFTVLTVYVH